MVSDSSNVRQIIELGNNLHVYMPDKLQVQWNTPSEGEQTDSTWLSTYCVYVSWWQLLSGRNYTSSHTPTKATILSVYDKGVSTK